MSTLKVNKFDPETIKPHRILLIIGRRGTGKSTLCTNLLYHLSDKVDFGLFMTPTEESSVAFKRFVPRAWVYDNFKQEKLEEMLRMQRELAKTKKQRNLICVLDDCMYDQKVMKGVAMRDLHMNGRHLKCQFVNCVQYLIDVPPAIRSQIDYTIVLKEPIYANQVKLWKYFFGIFDNFRDFAAVLKRCTENYSALVLDATQPTSEKSECLFWYRAPPKTPDFKLGNDVFWKLSKKYTQKPEEIARREREQKEVSRLDSQSRAKNERVTVVQRQDENGRTLPEDKNVLRIVA